MSEDLMYDKISDLCRRLGLYGMRDHVKDAEEGSPSYEEYLYSLLQSQDEYERSRSVEYKITKAGFPERKYLEDLERDKLPEDLRRRLPALTSLDFIRNGQNLILTGNPGTGKTHSAIGLGIKACGEGYRVIFVTLSQLATQLRESYTTRTLKDFTRRFISYDLAIVDELGYTSYDRASADLLFNCLSQRTTSKSTIITSNLSFARWDEVFGDPALTAALVDRLAYKAILVDMTGDSYRYSEAMKSAERDELTPDIEP